MQHGRLRIARSFWLVTHHEARAFGLVKLFADWLVKLTREHGDAL
ncbi:MAG: hypothetical protein V4808_05680 [Pseudomonadota bacterium]